MIQKQTLKATAPLVSTHEAVGPEEMNNISGRVWKTLPEMFFIGDFCFKCPFHIAIHMYVS